MDVHLVNLWWMVAWDHWIYSFGHSDGLLPDTFGFYLGSRVVLWILFSHSYGYPLDGEGFLPGDCVRMVPYG